MSEEEVNHLAAAADHRLVRRVLAGDQTAFDALFETAFPSLYRFALVRLGADADAAEDVVQEALCKAVAKLHTYRGEAALLTWLCTICRREIGAFLRRRGREPSSLGRLDETLEIRATLDALAACAGAQEEDLLRKEVGELVRLTLDNMPPRYGTALEWKYIEGLSVREIAERLQVGPKAAESLLTRARVAFREAFAVLHGGLQEGTPPPAPVSR